MGAKVEEDGESEEDEEEVMTRERLSQDMSVDREWGGRGCSRVGDSLELDDGADLKRLPVVRHKYGDPGPGGTSLDKPHSNFNVLSNCAPFLGSQR